MNFRLPNGSVPNAPTALVLTVIIIIIIITNIIIIFINIIVNRFYFGHHLIVNS